MLRFPPLENSVSQVDPWEEKLVNMRIKNHRYYGYSSIPDPKIGKKRQIEFALDVGVGEKDHKRKAYIAYGKRLEQLERGESPNLLNAKFSKVADAWKKNPVDLKGAPHGTLDNLRILDGLIIYFGGFKIKEIFPETIKTYHHEREIKGIKKSTHDKGYRVLKWVMHTVSKSWELPYLEYSNPEKEKPDESPSVNQVFAMIDALAKVEYGEEYQDIAQIMAFTGLDTSDAVNPSGPTLKDGILTGYRGKTGKRYRIGVSREIERIFMTRTGSPRFQIPSANSASKAISRAFDVIGLPQYHAKSLRDFYASVLYNAGYPNNYIQDCLGQVRGSTETKKYTKASAARLKKSASLFDNLFENRRACK